MDDIEKSRIEYVTKLEDQINHLQQQLTELKRSAAWQPMVHSEMDLDGKNGRITLSFGGKRMTAAVPTTALADADTTTITMSVLDTFCKNLIIDQLRPVVQPHVERLNKNANIMKGSGQW